MHYHRKIMKYSPSRLVLQYLFLFVLISTNGQKIATSEPNALHEFQDIKKGEDRLTHFLLSENKYQDNSPKDWLTVVDDYLKAAKESINVSEIRINLLIKAQLNYDLGYFERSVFIAEKLYLNIDKFNDQMKKELLNLLDIGYSKLGFYEKQIDVRGKKRDFGFTTDLHLHDIYVNLGYYEEAFKDFTSHEKQLIAEKDLFAQAKFYTHAGKLLLLDKKYAAALNYFEKAMGYNSLFTDESEKTKATHKSIQTKRLEGIIKANIGKCYSRQNDFNSATIFLEEAIILMREQPPIGQIPELTECKIELAHCYFSLGDYWETGKLLESEIGTLTIDNKIRYNRLSALYNNKIGNANKAVLFFEENDKIIDSVNSVKEQVHLQQLHALMSAEKENAKELIAEQLEVVERQKAAIAYKDSRINKSTVFAMVVLLAFGGLFWAYWRTVKNHRLITEQKHYIQQALIEKDSMLKEIHHRVRNNLQIVSSLLSLQVKETNSQEVIQALGEGRSRVKAMALIHQKLYQNEDLSVIDMQGYIESLISSVQSIYKNDRNNVKINIDVNDVELDIDRAIPFGLMLNELVSNSFKYAFPGTKDDGEISIHLSKNLERGGYFEYIDNGIGMPVENEEKSKTAMGIRLIKRLTNQLKSTLKIDNNSDGVRFYFNFS